MTSTPLTQEKEIKKKFTEEEFEHYLSLYRSGSNRQDIENYMSLFSHTFDDFVKQLKQEHCPSQRLNRPMKEIIALRHENGVPKKQISEELNLHPRTIKRACEAHGNNYQEGTQLTLFHSICEPTNHEIKFNDKGELICPISKRPCGTVISELSNNAYYSVHSGEEWHIENDILYRVKWEYVS